MVYYFSTELDKNCAARLKPFYSCHSAVASSCLRISLGLCLVSLFSIIWAAEEISVWPLRLCGKWLKNTKIWSMASCEDDAQ